MPNFRPLLPGVAALVALAVAAPPCEALRVAFVALPVPGRAVTADAVVVGKVAGVEPNPVAVAVGGPAGVKVNYRVALLAVETPLAGVKDVTHVKIGYVDRTPVPADPGAARPPVIRRPPVGEPKEGQEGVFFLVKHPSGEFYELSPLMPPLAKAEQTYAANVKRIEAALAAVADPLKALKADAAADRYAAAATLMASYRKTIPGAPVVLDPLPDRESELWLDALAEADWTAANTDDLPRPAALFYQLGVARPDGFVPVAFNGAGKPEQHLKAQFLAWRAGAGKDYRVKKYAAKPADPAKTTPPTRR